MKILIVFPMMLFFVKMLAQSPELKVYIDSVESQNNEHLVSVSAKIGKEYYSILSADKSSIVLQPDLDLRKIELVRFILKIDTVVFTISKILEGADISSPTVKETALKIIFHSVKRWHLRVEAFKHCDEEKIGSVVTANKKRNAPEYKSFKIYGLRTISWKFYVVKA